jgi:hypothetical protein
MAHCDLPECPREVGYQGRSGLVLLAQSLAVHDPKADTDELVIRGSFHWRRDIETHEVCPGRGNRAGLFHAGGSTPHVPAGGLQRLMAQRRAHIGRAALLQ